MSETTQVAFIGALSALMGGAVMWFIALRRMPRELRVLDSEESVNVSSALKSAAEAVDTIIRAQAAERRDLEARIDELEAHRSERSRQLYTLEKTQQDYAEQVSKLQSQVKALETQAAEWLAKYEKLKAYTERLRQALKDGGLDVPEMPADLLDTLERIKKVKG